MCGDLFLWMIFAITFYLIVLYHDVFLFLVQAIWSQVGSESSRISRWLFHFFNVHPYLGKWSNLTNLFMYFSDGLKPPTRYDLTWVLTLTMQEGCFFLPSSRPLSSCGRRRTKACYTTTLNPNTGLLVAWGSPKNRGEQWKKTGLVGGFKGFLFSPLPGEDSQFD